MSKAVEVLEREDRFRSTRRDETQDKGEFLKAAQCYINLAYAQLGGDDTLHLGPAPKPWPWKGDAVYEEELWSPDLIIKNNIKKAMVFLAAEWNRLDAVGW